MRPLVVVLLLVPLAGCTDDRDIDTSMDQCLAVVDDQMQPVPDAFVEISGPESRTGSTDGDGRVCFLRLQPGTYFASLRKDARTHVQISFDIPSSGERKVLLTPDS